MSDPKIDIKITSSGTNTVNKDLEKLEATAAKTDNTFKRIGAGLTKFGREIPGGVVVLDAIKNRFTAVSAVLVLGIAKAREYSAELNSMVSVIGRTRQPVADAGTAFKTAAEGVAAMAAAMRDLQTYTDGVTKGLQGQLEALDQQFAGMEKILDAEAELAKLKLDRDEADPVRRAQGKAAIDLRVAQTRLGFNAKKGQQAQIIGAQIDQERQLQIEAQENVPSRDAVVAAVSAYENDKASFDQAFTKNREAFGRAELLRRFVRETPAGESFMKTFAPSEVRELQKLGLISGISEIGSTGVFRGELKEKRDLAVQMLPDAEAAQAAARDALSRARVSLGASRGSLPAGVRSMADVDPFIDAANASAASVQNESYRRAETLGLKRDRLLQEQSVDIQVQKLRTQGVGIQGDLSVRDAEAAADRTAAQFQKFTDRLEKRLEQQDRHIEAIRRAANNNAQN